MVVEMTKKERHFTYTIFEMQFQPPQNITDVDSEMSHENAHIKTRTVFRTHFAFYCLKTILSVKTAVENAILF